METSGYFCKRTGISIDFVVLSFYDKEAGPRNQAKTVLLFEEFCHELTVFVREHPIMDFRYNEIHYFGATEPLFDPSIAIIVQDHPSFKHYPVFKGVKGSILAYNFSYKRNAGCFGPPRICFTQQIFESFWMVFGSRLIEKGLLKV